MGKGIKLVSLILIVISFLILFLYIDILLYPNSIVIHNFIDEETAPEIADFDYEYKQNQSDYSYQITVVKASGPKLKTEIGKIRIDDVVNNALTEPISINDFKSTKEFLKNNLSISITYFDSDNDDYLSKGDFFIISFKDIEKNEFFNYSQYKYGEFDFCIKNEDGHICGCITINERYSEIPGPSSEVASSRGIPLCYFLIIIILVFIIIQIFFFIYT